MPFISSVRSSFGTQGRFNRRSLQGSTGGTITTSGAYTVHTFSTAGTYTFTAVGAGPVEYLIVAGGGGGATRHAGGGGGGGLVT